MASNSDTLIEFPEAEENPITVFSKNPSAFVVAFALKETYDDLVTAQQMICNKRSPQPSNNSITPTNSLKLIVSTHTLKLENTEDFLENNDNVIEENKLREDSILSTLGTNNSELNEENTDQNRIIRFTDTDATTDSDEKSTHILKLENTQDLLGNNNNVTEENKLRKDSFPSILDTKNSELIEENTGQNRIIHFTDTDATTDSDENSENKTGNIKESDQPEIIFNAVNYAERKKRKPFLIKKIKINKTITQKCSKFKCKTSKNGTTYCVEKYFKNSKQNPNGLGEIREAFSNISTVVSRTRVLKNGLAKENLLEETEASTYKELHDQFLENDDSPQAPYPSTAKNESFISNSSGKTLTSVSSRSSSKNEDISSIKTVKSITEMALDSGCISAYRTDVINVAVAVSYDKSKTIPRDSQFKNNEKFIHLAGLTSQPEPLSKKMTKLTSKVPSDFETITLESIDSRKKTEKINETSDVTLVNRKSSFNVSSDDTFDLAQTSSELNKSGISTITLKNDVENESNNEKEDFNSDEKSTNRQKSILETVISLGYYPEMTPSTSSGVGVAIVNQKDVFIAGTDYHVCSKNMGDHRKENKKDLNVLRKSFKRDMSPTKKSFNIPNNERIKKNITEDMQQVKHQEESKIPFDISDMWEKLIIVLDVAFKRLETTITDKIIRELKESIASLEFRAQPILEVDVDLEEGKLLVTEPSQQEIDSSQNVKENERSLQCSLVQSKVIDEMMRKQSILGPKIKEPERSINSLKKYKSKLIREYLQILKPPIVIRPEVVEDIRDKSDTMTISTGLTDTVDRFSRLKLIFFAPVRFVRENLVVIASVPAFFVVFLFIYGILMLLVKPL